MAAHAWSSACRCEYRTPTTVPPADHGSSNLALYAAAQPRCDIGVPRINDLTRLAELLAHGRDTVLKRWREQIRALESARHLDVPTLNDHIPGLLTELGEALLAGRDDSIPEVLQNGSSTSHGLQRVTDAFDIEEVVSEYNILRGCIHDLADENGIGLQGRPFHIINGVFDHAIGLALQTYATRKAAEVRQRREEYLAFVAHDLRNPLNAISLVGSALEKSARHLDTDDRDRHLLKILRRSIDQLERLVKKVLEENTPEQTDDGLHPERREFDLWPFVEALVQDFQPAPVAMGSGTLLVNRIPEELVVYADADLLKRIFQNLISNAIRYTARGKIVIEATQDSAGTVECRVTDNGIGIPADMIDRVFEKGETDDINGDGNGLGLAIVKTFAEAHGGSVGVESREGMGAMFRFSLPGRDSITEASATR